MVQTLHDDAGGEAEETGLIVIAVGGVALDPELIPRPGVYLILARPEAIELQKDRDRFAGHFPTADTKRRKTAFSKVERRKPFFQEGFVFLKEDITVIAEIGTEEKHFVGVLRLHGSRAGTKHRINTAYAVAYFPRGFKNIIRLHYLGSLSTAIFVIFVNEFKRTGVVTNLLLSDPTKGMYHTPCAFAQ